MNNTESIDEDTLIELLTLTCTVNSIGTKVYRNNEGQTHRIHGPAVIYTNGEEHWYKNNLIHRENGPAISYPGGLKYWFKNGKRHREDGPAIIYTDGSEEFWINDNQISKQNFIKMTHKLS